MAAIVLFALCRVKGRVRGFLRSASDSNWTSEPEAGRKSIYDLVSTKGGTQDIKVAEMSGRVTGASPRLKARMTGVVYLLYFLTAISAEVLVGRGRLVAYDAVTLVAHALYIAVTLLFYGMFRRVNTNLSLLAALFSLVGCAIEVMAVFSIVPRGVNSLALFGPYCLLIGYLVFRSTFLPRILGVLMMLAGLGWLIFLTPLASNMSSYLKALGFIAELLLCLWLIVIGVNVPKWQEKTRAWQVGNA